LGWGGDGRQGQTKLEGPKKYCCVKELILKYIKGNLGRVLELFGCKRACKKCFLNSWGLKNFPLKIPDS
jgi:hypothetical protein